jgi:phenylalanyl-tRNA synthetase beta chain
MLVCWEWLSQYVKLNVDPDTMAHRFAMSGLNHESTTKVGSDTVIDLEVTSNRGDCLGHIGVAREAAVLLGTQLCIPDPKPPVVAEKASGSIAVENRFPDGCSRYTARIVRGVKIGPSPEWLVRRLAAIGINSVNNVVDVTNYVMMECGQPLHAFDLKHLRGGKVIVRCAAKGEKFLAIDHHTYDLDEKMIVIADAERAVALGGVMGGAESEVSSATTDLLIESAAFEPLLIRRAARKLKLQSPSSYRFERRPDPAGLDWASRRCCELILQVAGGKLCNGCVDTAGEPEARQPIAFRMSQIPRVLGIDVPYADVAKIMTALGCKVETIIPQMRQEDADAIVKEMLADTERTRFPVPAEPHFDRVTVRIAEGEWHWTTVDGSEPATKFGNQELVSVGAPPLRVTPPSWRPDLSREVDLIEEIARIYGYEKIPEDVTVPMSVAPQRPKDIALRRARNVLSAYGVDEAMTPSVVTEQLDQCGSIWTDTAALVTETPLLIGAKQLRRTILPSLLAAMYTNQSQSIRSVNLYEVSTIFLPSDKGTALPREQSTLSIVVTSNLPLLKGIVEDLITQVVSTKASLQWTVINHPFFLSGSAQRIELNAQLLGFVGVLNPKLQTRLALDHAVAVAELNVDWLTQHLEEVRRADAVSTYPAVARDLNFIVDEPLRWSDLSAACELAGGNLLQHVNYCETYRDPSKDGANKKRVLLTLQFQSMERTLTSDDVDTAVSGIVEHCAKQFGAKLLG